MRTRSILVGQNKKNNNNNDNNNRSRTVKLTILIIFAVNFCYSHAQYCIFCSHFAVFAVFADEIRIHTVIRKITLKLIQ